MMQGYANELRAVRFALCCALLLAMPAVGASPDDAAKPRARDAGVPFPGTPGPRNAITDVPGVEVGQVTIIHGVAEAGQRAGEGPARTGVTAVFPRGRAFEGTLHAGAFALNGTGELTGKVLIDEYGEFAGPIVTTGTGSVGVVRDAVIEWYRNRLDPELGQFLPYIIPVVGETYDGRLNDLMAFHVTREHVFEALDSARSGPVAEGNVGGGTGMVAFHFAGGIGTSSRVLPAERGGYTVGVLVQANFGGREQLTIAGVPVGEHIRDLRPRRHSDEDGSIIIVIVTDAPLLPKQLERVARRASHGLARTGGMSGTGSGDIFVAVSTALPETAGPGTRRYEYLDSGVLNPLFSATVLATEEAIVNVLFAARDLTGINHNTVYALPQDRTLDVLRRYNRLVDPDAQGSDK